LGNPLVVAEGLVYAVGPFGGFPACRLLAESGAAVKET